MRYKVEEGFYTANDSIKLFYKHHIPLQGKKASIIIIQGSGGGKDNDYNNFSNGLALNQFEVFKIDERGTGYSEGTQGDIPDYTIIVNDYREFITKVVQKNKEIPVILVGHSSGGVLVTKIAYDLQEVLGGVILINPMYKAVANYNPSFVHILYFGFNYIFRRNKPLINLAGNPERIKFDLDKNDALENLSDSRVVKYFSMRYLMGCKKLIDKSERYAKQIKLPLLMVIGAKDDYCDQEKTQKIFEHWPNDVKTKLVLKDAGHGTYITNYILNDVLKWLNCIAQDTPEPKGK